MSKPEQAVLSQEMRETLRRLVGRYPVTIVSGRDASVVEHLVGLNGLGFVGSHGLDIQGPPGTGIQKEVGVEFQAALDLAEAELHRRIGFLSGVIIERKRFSISTHVRLVAVEQLAQVEAEVNIVCSSHQGLRREGGKMLFELRPDVDWDKGSAVSWILNEMHLRTSAALFVGDDLTDETVFHLMGEKGLGIVVAEEARLTEACLRLADPIEVRVLLERLIDLSDAFQDLSV
jgi:trehalose-phosphatase